MVLPFQSCTFRGTGSMNAFTVDYGRLVDAVTCSVSVVQTDSVPAQYVRCNALWDTGALYTVVSRRLVAQMGLEPIDTGIAYTVQGSYEASIYLLDLMLPNQMLVKALRVSEGDFDDCDILIGMDVIRLGDFSISNLRKTVFSFRIPAEGFSPIHGVT